MKHLKSITLEGVEAAISSYVVEGYPIIPTFYRSLFVHFEKKKVHLLPLDHLGSSAKYRCQKGISNIHLHPLLTDIIFDGMSIVLQHMKSILPPKMCTECGQCFRGHFNADHQIKVTASDSSLYYIIIITINRQVEGIFIQCVQDFNKRIYMELSRDIIQ